uniref:hypothetical protein n=1 Tax=Anaerosporobacter sp. TaxID=1872529 RepID=UPI00286F40FB
RVKATDEKFASLPLTVTVAKRAVAPSAVYTAASDAITGVSTAMEYSLDGGLTWISSTTTTIPRSVFGNETALVKVRVKATATAAKSEVKDITVTDGPAQAPTGFQVDIKNEKVTGVSNLMEYSTNGTSWKAITGDTMDISAIIPAATATADLTLKIRVKATSTIPASQIAEIVIPRRIATPLATNVKFEGTSETILLSDTMEYRIGTTGDYTSVEEGKTSLDVTVDSVAKTYQIRVKATAEKFASLPLAVTVAKRAAAPSAVYTAASDAITGVSTAMEYSLDGGSTWISSTTTTIPRSVFGNETALVKVRVKATATAAKSEVKDITVPDGPAQAPTGFQVDIKNEKVTGVSNLMEYSTNGTSWKAITGDTLDISAIIPAATAVLDLTLKIRVKATTTIPASQIAEVVIPRRIATPLAANVKFEGTSETILLSDTMEYRLGTTGDYISVEEGKTCLDVTVDNVAKSYQIRVKATDEQFASLPLTVTVAKRATAPSVVYTAVSDSITGVSTAMEYSLDGGLTWISATEKIIPRSVLGNEAIVVKIRIKATVTAAKSEVKDIIVPEGLIQAPASFSDETYEDDSSISFDEQQFVVTGDEISDL